MALNYTPLDSKKYPVPGEVKPDTAAADTKSIPPPATHTSSSKIDAILIGIIVITLGVLGVLLFMLFQKSI